MRTPSELRDRLRAEGRKVTPQREAVIQVLDGNGEHPTAESVHVVVVSQLPMVSLRTVYQVLSDLADLGEIQAIDVGTGAVRFDPNVDRHHHLVCTVCGRVMDVAADEATPMTAVPASVPAGFVVERAEVVFRGRCATCASPSPA